MSDTSKAPEKKASARLFWSGCKTAAIAALTLEAKV